MGSEEDLHLLEIRQARLTRLRIIEQQIAQFGDPYAPSHLIADRAKLRAELDIADTAISAPASTDIGDEMGAGARFLVHVEILRQTREAVAEVGRDVKNGFRWLWFAIGALTVALAAVITYLAVRG